MTAESAVIFRCQGETLVGVLAEPDRASDLGIVIVVGGPQTRIGSHRQFVLLARALADAGYPTLRFDYRGMGDSSGPARDFLAVSEDIAAAISALQAHCPTVQQIVLWGLCDAASAALLYCDEMRDSRVVGLCLLNPWVRSQATLAKTQVKHYYGRRLLQREFWAKLFSGRLNVFAALTELAQKLAQARRKPAPEVGFQARMARGWRNFPGPILLILAGNDYTAKEFLEYTAMDLEWEGLLTRPNVARIEIASADHTFSSREWRNSVENACLDWLKHYG